jgi:hypothetical protein
MFLKFQDKLSLASFWRLFISVIFARLLQYKPIKKGTELFMSMLIWTASRHIFLYITKEAQISITAVMACEQKVKHVNEKQIPLNHL